MAPSSVEFEDWYFDQLEFEKAKLQKVRKRDIVQELLEDLEAKEAPPGGWDIDRYLADRLETTKAIVDQVHKEIDLRAELHSRFLAEINSQITYAQLSLEKFSGWGVGYNTGVDVKRNHLERVLLQLRSERRAAALKAWQHLVRMRKDLRDACREYRDSRRLDDLNRN